MDGLINWMFAHFPLSDAFINLNNDKYLPEDVQRNSMENI